MIASTEEPGIEVVNDTLDLGEELRDDWANLPVVTAESGFPKAYGLAKRELHVHFRMRVVGVGELKEFCAVFFALPQALRRNGLPLGWPLAVGELWHYDQDHAMFVDIVEFSKKPRGCRWPGRAPFVCTVAGPRSLPLRRA